MLVVFLVLFLFCFFALFLVLLSVYEKNTVMGWVCMLWCLQERKENPLEMVMMMRLLLEAQWHSSAPSLNVSWWPNIARCIELLGSMHMWMHPTMSLASLCNEFLTLQVSLSSSPIWSCMQWFAGKKAKKQKKRQESSSLWQRPWVCTDACVSKRAAKVLPSGLQCSPLHLGQKKGVRWSSIHSSPSFSTICKWRAAQTLMAKVVLVTSNCLDFCISSSEFLACREHDHALWKCCISMIESSNKP